MFWSLGFNSKIDTILDRKTGFSLDELLDEDEVLQECKANNSKLIEFLVVPSTLATLVEYVTTMPAESDSFARKYKYPYVASEVLCSDVGAVREALVADQGALILSLFALLDQPAPLPPVLAGYVSKVVIGCYKAQPEALKALSTPSADDKALQGGESASGLAWPTLMPRLLAHLGSDSILQLLLTTCVGEPPSDDMDGPPFGVPPAAATAAWFPLEELVTALLALLPEDAETSANAAELLCCILSSAAELPPCLSDQQVGARVASLVDTCTGGVGAIGQPINNGALEVLLKLLVRCREQPNGPKCPAAIAEALAERIELIFLALASPPARPPHIARFLPDGGTSFPLGASRQRCGLLALIEQARLAHCAACPRRSKAE